MSVAAYPGVLPLAARKGRDQETLVLADENFPAIVAQNVGRDICYGRQEVVRIVGDKRSLEKIAWIFQKVPDMFTIQLQRTSLVVTASREQRPVKRQNGKKSHQSLRSKFYIWLRRKLK